MPIWNVFIQDEINFPALDITVTLGTKIEGNTYSGSEIQPSFRGSWVPSEQFTWWWAASHASRTPSRSETSGVLNAQILPAFSLFLIVHYLLFFKGKGRNHMSQSRLIPMSQDCAGFQPMSWPLILAFFITTILSFEVLSLVHHLCNLLKINRLWYYRYY